MDAVFSIVVVAFVEPTILGFIRVGSGRQLLWEADPGLLEL